MRSLQSSRRTFLRGAGVTLALPFLESLTPPKLFAQTVASPPKRLLYWFIPNGVIYSSWIPSVAGPLNPAALPACLQPLAGDAGVTGDVTVISGLDNLCGAPVGQGDHASGLAAMLTCVPAVKTVTDVKLGQSADQLAAAAVGKLSARPSLELGMAKSGSGGNCDNGYACAYAQSMSWNDAQTPRPKRTDPHDAWLYLLGTDGTALTAAQQAQMRAGDKSVLDYLLAQSSAIKPRIGAADQMKLEQYLTGVRSFEQQVTSSMSSTNPQCQATSTGPANSTDYITRLNAMFDVMEFAFKCDLTRVITFMFGNAFGPGPMPWINIADDFHALTHKMNDAGVPAKVAACITWEVSQIAAFAKRLKAIPEGGQTVLYNTSWLVTSDVGQGGPHNHDNMPVLLIGNGGGAFKSGRHLAFVPEDASARSLAGTRILDNRTKAIAIPNTNRLSNLHLSLLKNAGVTIDSFSDSTGPLKGL
jgi:hypothetical protein